MMTYEDEPWTVTDDAVQMVAQTASTPDEIVCAMEDLLGPSVYDQTREAMGFRP